MQKLRIFFILNYFSGTKLRNNSIPRKLANELLTVLIQTEEKEKHQREAKERRSAIAEERQWDTDYRHKAYSHTDIDGEMEEENAYNAIAIDAAKDRVLLLCEMNQPEEEYQIQDDEESTPSKPPLFAYGTENEVGRLLRDEVELGLSTLQEALTRYTTGTDGNEALLEIPASALRVFLNAKKHIDTCTLMLLENIIEYITCGERDTYTHPQVHKDKRDILYTLGQCYY